jgi:small subunit ribosomal protein S3Ae
LTQDTWTELITNNCKFVYPLQNVTIRKVKILKRPKIDVVKMAEMYTHDKTKESGKGANEEGVQEKETQNLLKVEKEEPKKTPKVKKAE